MSGCEERVDMKKAMWNWKRLAMLGTLFVLALMLPCAAVAQENVFVKNVTADDVKLPDNDELFAGFVNRQFYADRIQPKSSNYGASVLPDARNIAIYQVLKTEIERIAREGGSAEIVIPAEVFGDLVFDISGAASDEEIKKIVSEEFGKTIDTGLILQCLLIDCPYELYWFNKVKGGGMYSGYSYGYNSSIAVIQSIVFGFSVVPAYQADGYSENAPAVTTDVSAVNAAVSNARSVVSRNVNGSDIEKLTAYKNYICDAVSYNDAAAKDDYVPTYGYGDPWQMIWAFDGDSSTNIVCEGYSKAFAYLCELSEFEDEEFACRIMSGDTVLTGRNPGGHMWNVVCLNGYNYIVDVTNSDAGSIGQDGELFMNAEPMSGDANGYHFAFGSYVLSYTYDAETVALYSEDKRTLGTVGGVDVAIDAENFPDDAFRAYVAETFDMNGDGALSMMECANVTQVIVPGKGIASLEGIEFFPNLDWISAGDNQLTALDVSQNTKLTSLMCGVNGLTNLDLSENVLLDYLDCSENQLTALNLSANTELVNLNCNMNQLTALDVSGLNKLEVLTCGWNPIKTLNVSENSALRSLSCESTGLTTLDVSRNAGLTSLSCEENALTTLNLSGNPLLESLSCRNNQITALDFSNNRSLEELYFDNNKLTDVDVSMLKSLKYLGCSDNQLGVLDVSDNTALRSLTCDDAGLTVLDVSQNTELVLLSCENNALTTLDVTTLRDLEEFYCGRNQLGTLDVSGNKALWLLSCGQNELTALDVSNLAELNYLSCEDNALTELDVSSNRSLMKLTCSGNALTSLDINVSGGLDLFECEHNVLDILIEHERTFDLTTLPGGFDANKASDWMGASVSGNTLTIEEEASEATYAYDCGSGHAAAFTLNVSGIQPPKIAVSEENFPDAMFRTFVRISFDQDGDDELSVQELQAVTSIEAPEWSIASLQGIEFFENLEYLACNSNQIAQLDVSQNTALEVLDCSDNPLTALDVRANIALQDLAADETGLKELDVSGNLALTGLSLMKTDIKALDVTRNKELRRLNAGNCDLEALDVGQNEKLRYLWCYDNALTTLDVSGNPNLEILSCGGNQLTVLDVSGNVALTDLYASDNQLTSLDVSGLSVLETLEAEACYYTIYANIDRTFDLTTLPGRFDVSKASGWRGASVSGNMLNINEGSWEVTYAYDCGNGYTATFILDCGIELPDENEAVLTLPEQTTQIGDEAFAADVSITKVVLPEGAQSIGAGAFRGCIRLLRIVIPSADTTIGADAFEGCDYLNIEAPLNSKAHAYAREYGIAFEEICPPEPPIPLDNSMRVVQ